MGSPLFMAIAFSLAGLWIVFMALPGLRHPPIASKTKICPDCGVPNLPDAAQCEKCGVSIASPSVDQDASR